VSWVPGPPQAKSGPVVLSHKTTAFVLFWSNRRSACPSFYNRTFPTSGSCYCLEWPADSRHISTVARDLQTASQDMAVFSLLSWHCDWAYSMGP